MMRAAIGFRAHSGWAVVVTIAQSGGIPVVVDRVRIELVDPGIPGSKQPYHEAEGMDLRQAQQYIRRCDQTAKRLASQALRKRLRELAKRQHEVTGCGILLGSARPLPVLSAILASHALIHTAEGVLFREALIHACEQCSLRVLGIKERELYEQATHELRLPAGELRKHLSEMGRVVGPPWRQDHKDAALAAWLVLRQGKR